MMQVIRDKAQGIVAWVIVGIIAFVMVFWGVSGYINNGNGTKVLAKVNGRQITSAEVDNIYNRWLHVNSSQPGFDIAQVDPDVVKKQITIGLAQQSATIGQLVNHGMAISEEMIINNIRSKQEFQVDSKFSIDKYKHLLQQSGVSEAEFEALMRDQMLIEQLQLAVLASSFVTTNDAERMVAISNQTRDFGYAVIDAEKFQKNAKITDEAVSEFYNTHKERFLVPESIQVEYIDLSLNKLLAQIKVDEQKLQEYYKDNQQSFVQPRRLHLSHIMLLAPEISEAATSGQAQKQIEEIYAQLEKGAKFNELVKKYSEDKQSAQKGGDIGWVMPGDDYPVQVFSLQKNGDYTKPIQTEYGWHIFMLTENQGGNVRSFSEVRDIIAERYKYEEAQRLFAAKGDELANIVFENPSSLSYASEQLDLPIQTSEFFGNQGGSGIAASENVVRAAFSDDVLVQKHNSELIRLNDDNYVVLRLKDKIAAHTQELEEAAPDIREYLKRIAAKEEAMQIGAELIAAIQQSNNPNKAASAQSLDWVVEKNVERDNKNINRAILERTFVMQKPNAGEAFVINGFSLPNGDYAVVALTRVKEGEIDKSGDSNIVENVSKQLAKTYGQIDFACLQEALIAQAKIKYY